MQEDNNNKKEKLIRVSQETYERLLQQAIVEQDKTHDDIINRLIDEREALKELLLQQEYNKEHQKKRRPSSLSLSPRGGFARYVRDLENLSE